MTSARAHIASMFLAAVAVPACVARSTAASSPPMPITELTVTLPGLGDTPARGPTDPAMVAGVVLSLGGSVPSDPRLLVATVDVARWSARVHDAPSGCFYPAGDLETAAQALEQAWGLPTYLRPILVGEGAGAAITYFSIASAPADTFSGGVAVGLCPDWRAPRPLCGSHSGGWAGGSTTLPRAASLPIRPDGAPRLAVVAPCAAASELLAGVDAELAHAPDVDAAVAPFVPQVSTAGGAQPPPEVAQKLDALGLPLSYEWAASPRRVVLFLSGDGGWAEIDRGVAAGLAAQGIAVVGVSSLAYFWRGADQATLAADLRRIVDALPSSLPVALGGYSFGADVAPFALQDLPSRVDRLVLLDPSEHPSWQVGPEEMLLGSGQPQQWVPAAIRAAARPTLCLRSDAEADSGCPDGDPKVQVVRLTGGHHFGGDYASLAATVSRFLEAP